MKNTLNFTPDEWLPHVHRHHHHHHHYRHHLLPVFMSPVEEVRKGKENEETGRRPLFYLKLLTHTLMKWSQSSFERTFKQEEKRQGRRLKAVFSLLLSSPLFTQVFMSHQKNKLSVSIFYSFLVVTSLFASLIYSLSLPLISLNTFIREVI